MGKQVSPTMIMLLICAMVILDLVGLLTCVAASQSTTAFPIKIYNPRGDRVMTINATPDTTVYDFDKKILAQKIVQSAFTLLYRKAPHNWQLDRFESATLQSYRIRKGSTLKIEPRRRVRRKVPEPIETRERRAYRNHIDRRCASRAIETRETLA